MTLRTLDLPASLLPSRERARVEAYALTDTGFGTDVFGTDTRRVGHAYAFAYWLHRSYFRVVSTGHDNIPHRGAAVLVGNHGGVLPFDALMLVTDVFRHLDPPRLVHYMVDHFVYRLPFVGVFFRSLGQMPGTRGNFDGLVEHGHLVGVFPEGARALAKRPAHRYRVGDFTPGHVELAARHGAPIVPFGLVGAEDQMTLLADLQPLARALRLPFFPITTTLLVPRRVRYFIHYGPPIHVDRDALVSLEVRKQETERVREAVIELVREGLAARERHADEDA